MKGLLEKYRSIPIQLKAAFWFTACNLLQNGLHLITMPIYTRMLTTEEYGLSTLYFAWADIVIIFSTLKLAAGVFNNGMVHFEDDRDRFQSSMLGLSTVSGLICLGLYIVFWKLFDSWFGLPHLLVVVMFVYCIFHPALTYWTARQRYEYKYMGFTIATLGLAIVTSLCSVLLITFFKEKGLMKIIGFVFASTVINLGFYFYIFARGKTFYDKKYWSYALKFNLPLIPHYLSMIILNQCDRIMIATICGQSQAGMYGVAYNIGKIALIFNGAVTASFTPWIYNKLKKKHYDGVAKMTFTLFWILTVIIVGIMLLGPEVIRVFATEEYAKAVYVIPPIAASAFFVFVYNQVSTVEFFYGKSKYIMIASLAGAILNVALNLIAIDIFGFIAAAYTSLICYIMFAICHFLLMRLLCKRNKIKTILFDGRKLVIMSVIVLLIMILMNFIYQFTFLRYSLCIMIIGFFISKRNEIIRILKNVKSN